MDTLWTYALISVRLVVGMSNGLFNAFPNRPTCPRPSALGNTNKYLLIMELLAYCRACLIKVAMAENPEDRVRLDALLDSWTPGGELKERQGHCGRCGQYDEVSYYSPLEPDN